MPIYHDSFAAAKALFKGNATVWGHPSLTTLFLFFNFSFKLERTVDDKILNKTVFMYFNSNLNKNSCVTYKWAYQKGG